MQALLLLLPLALADAAANAVGGVQQQCSKLLGGLATSAHSDAELAAYCRASYPVEMCRLMKGSLGSFPWTPSRISSTCDDLDARVRELGATSGDDGMSYEDFQQALEGSAEQKRKLGYELPRHRDGSVDFDTTVRQKYQQTLVIIRAYDQYMGYETEPGQMSQQKWQKSGAAGEGHDLTSVFAFAVLSISIAGAIGGVVLFVRRMPRRTVTLLRHRREQAGQPETEEAEENIE